MTALNVFNQYHLMPPEFNPAAVLSYDPMLAKSPYIKPETVYNLHPFDSNMIAIAELNPLFDIKRKSYDVRVRRHNNRTYYYYCNPELQPYMIHYSYCDHSDCVDSLFTRDIYPTSDCDLDKQSIHEYSHSNGCDIDYVAQKVDCTQFIDLVGWCELECYPSYDAVNYYKAGMITLDMLHSIATPDDILQNNDILWTNNFIGNANITLEIAVMLNVRKANWNTELRLGISLLHPELQAYLLYNEPTNYTMWAMRRHISNCSPSVCK